MQLPNPWVEPTISIEVGGRIIANLGRTAAYEAAHTGRLPTIAVGARRKVVPTAALYEILGLPLPPAPAPKAG